jgi:hypothetical protein
MSSSKTASILAIATASIFLLLLGVVHWQGVTQQYFELVHTPEKYTAEIVEHYNGLNIIFVLDNIFILLYTCTALFTIHTWKNNAPYFVVVFATALVAIVGVLDYVENFHIYALMQQAKKGLAVAAVDIQWQAAESMLKWHLAYAAFFFMGFLVPVRNALSKMFKYSLWGWFVLSGVLVYAFVDTDYANLFQWIRYINLFTGFIIIFILMRKESSATA